MTQSAVTQDLNRLLSAVSDFDPELASELAERITELSVMSGATGLQLAIAKRATEEEQKDRRAVNDAALSMPARLRAYGRLNAKKR